jgi:hypothetical protein
MFCLPLRHEPIVVVGTCVALTADLIEHRDELPFRIDRELECFDGSIMFTSAAANHPISACSQGSSGQGTNGVVCQIQLGIRRRMAGVIFESTLTCPYCGHTQTEQMPQDQRQFFLECVACHAMLRPKPGDCCEFCSFGSIKCPSIQVTDSCDHSEPHSRKSGWRRSSKPSRARFDAGCTIAPLRSAHGSIRSYSVITNTRLFPVTSTNFAFSRSDSVGCDAACCLDAVSGHAPIGND